MKITQVDTPETKAEGLCAGIPYNTDTYNSQGCSIHFWVGSEPNEPALRFALHRARNARDVVMATWSLGQPTGFWANEEIK